MFQIRSSRRVATVAACGIFVLQIVHLSRATATAAPFDGGRHIGEERSIVGGGDRRCRHVVALGMGWMTERPVYVKNKEKHRRTRFERSKSSSSSAHCVNENNPRRTGEQHSRAIFSLLELRGGSEGLKSEAYDPQKAAAGTGSKTSGKGSSPAKPPDGHDDYSYGGDSYKAHEGNIHYWESYAMPPAINLPGPEATGASRTPPHLQGNPHEGSLLGDSVEVDRTTTRTGETASVAGLVRAAVRAAAAETAAATQQKAREALSATGVGLGVEATPLSLGAAGAGNEASAAAGKETSPAGGNGVSTGRFSSDNDAMASSVAREGEAERAREALAGEGSFLQEPDPEVQRPGEEAALARTRRPWGHHEASVATFPIGLGDAKVSVEDGDNGVKMGRVASSLARTRALGSVRGVMENPLQQQQQQPRGRSKLVWKPKYLTVKAVFFLFYSSLGAIMPYLPVYYHSLAIPDSRIGHLGAITPAMTFLFTPLWGALTDKSGMLKQILLATFVASTLLRVSLAARTSFAWIVSIVAMTAIVNAPVRPLLDSSALQALDDRGEYGKQRLWGQWGFGIGSFVTGRLLSKFGFKVAFYMHAAFSLPALLILLRFNPKKEDRAKTPPKFGELYKLMVHDPNVTVFFSMVFAIGLSSGVIENFAYKRLRELGGTGSVLGMSRLVSSLAGIPMFFYSGAIVKKFSIVAILTAAMMSYIARFVIYACIKNPWAGLPAEALRGVTFAGFWAASTCHVGAIAPPGLSTTMLGLLNATYGGIGQSLGSLIGGSLSAHFGTARAFLVYAAVDGLLLLAYFTFWGVRPQARRNTAGAGDGMDPSPGGDVYPPGTKASQPLSAEAETLTAPPSPARDDMSSAHAFESKSR